MEDHIVYLQSCMYQYSRAIYRSLKDLIDPYNDHETQLESRRTVLTSGIDLNALVGVSFTVGEVACEGVELCEPCLGLAKLTEFGVLRGLVHRGGLRADIVSDGEIAVGDSVRAE